jgi:N-acetylglucosaminyl-diphospho-decaprenol L-rhamnosyltransferase
MKELYQNITITIVIYQENLTTISNCLKNFKNFKIIIIDNAGNKKLKTEIEKEFIIFKYIINKKNVGFSKATNQAINLCDTELILHLQADCTISIDSILKLYESLKKYEDCIIVTPTFYDNKSNLTYSGGPFPEKKIEIQTLALEGDACVDVSTTAAILFKKKDLLEIGLFDEDFFIYFPDFEIGRRIKKLKKSIIQVYEAKAIHEMGYLKINNLIKKTFVRNYYFTLDELIYYHKKSEFNNVYFNLKKKIISLIIKSLFNLMIFKFVKSTKSFSRILAFYNFKKKYLRK